MIPDGRDIAVVTGATGFLGRHVTKALRRAGHVVRAPARNAFCPGLDAHSARGLFDGAATFIHLAWQGTVTGSEPRPAADHDANVSLAEVLFRAACQSNVRRIVFASSGGSVYGESDGIPIPEGHPLRPTNSYGAAKVAAETAGIGICKGRDTKFISLRLSNLYGPGQRGDLGRGLIATAIWRSLAGRELEVWGDGTQVRDYLFVADAAKAFVKAVGYTGQLPVFNIGSGTGLSVNEVIEQVRKSARAAPSISFKASRAVDASRNVLQVSRAARHLGWQAQTPLDRGMASAILWSKCMLERGHGN